MARGQSESHAVKIAVTDYTFPNLEIEGEILGPLGHEIVAWKEKRSPAELLQLVADADAIVTQFAPVTAEVIGAMQRAKVIVRYGIGVDNVDLDAARDRGIPVCNVPDYCIDEVADHTLAFILALTRQVLPNCTHIRAGKWGLATPINQMRALSDLTIGIIGFGRIGREVAARLRPFKCRILVFDPAIPATEIEHAGCTLLDQQELFAQADIITLHCPSTHETRGLIGESSLARMKRGVILVNVARGDLVDSAVLTAALQSGHIAAAALDVFFPEPIPADHPILKLDNVLLSSHIASCSPSAAHKLRTTVAHLAASALRGEKPSNIVNGV
jgi:D-3-phosphoglycerate dehydrogenase